jgi:hypothetical protein
MQIEKANATDLPLIMEIYANARIWMAENGNPTQRGTTYPPQAQIQQDISLGNCYLCKENDELLGVFVFLQ